MSTSSSTPSQGLSALAAVRVAIVTTEDARERIAASLSEAGFEVTHIIASPESLGQAAQEIVQPTLFGPQRDGIESLVSETDFVWLGTDRLNDPFVGEVRDVAAGLGLPVFAASATYAVAKDVAVVRAPGELWSHPTISVLRAASGLVSLQAYYEGVAKQRGWENERPQDTILMLIEELGELAREIRELAGLSRDHDYPTSRIAEELADVQLYLVHLASGLGIDLASSVVRKERRNAQRHARRKK